MRIFWGTKKNGAKEEKITWLEKEFVFNVQSAERKKNKA